MYNGGGTPAINILDWFAPVYALVVFGKVYRGNFNLMLRQPFGDLIWAVSFQRQSEDLAYNSSGFFIHNPVFPFLILQIAVNDGASQMLAAHALGLERGADSLAGVLRVDLVYDVPYG